MWVIYTKVSTLHELQITELRTRGQRKGVRKGEEQITWNRHSSFLQRQQYVQRGFLSNSSYEYYFCMIWLYDTIIWFEFSSRLLCLVCSIFFCYCKCELDHCHINARCVIITVLLINSSKKKKVAVLRCEYQDFL